MLTTPAPGIYSARPEVVAYQFKVEHIPLIWEELEPLIERSVKAGADTLEVTKIRDMLFAGDATVFCNVRAAKIEFALVATIVDYPFHRAAFVLAAAGKDMTTVGRILFPQLEYWAFKQGASEMEAVCMDNMTRLLRKFGYRKKSNVVTKDLRGKLQ